MTIRWPSWLNATALLAASFVAVAALSLQARRDADLVAVVFPPWWTAGDALEAAAAAEAAIVRTTALSSIVVVRPRGGDGLARLRAAGGWFALDPRAAGACLNF
jgi:hypothetical protein